MDIQILTGGFDSTSLQFTALSSEGQRWLNFAGGTATEAITIRKSQANPALDDIKSKSLTIDWV